MSSSLDLAQLSRELQADIGLRAAILGEDALDELATVLPASGGVAVLTDAVPKRRGQGDLLSQVEQRLGGRDLKRVVLRGRPHRVHADEGTVAAAVEGVDGASALVTVGSGTLADIGKAVSARLGGLPHVVVQTATSVNGFADDQSVLLLNGVKRTTHTRWPDALIADAEVLAAAPPDLNVAGVGDLLAMFTAPADWRLAHVLGMADSYAAPVVDLTRRHGQEVLELAPRLAGADAEAATAIARVLALSGIAMGVAGTTAPASGMEHTVSHLIEMAATSRGEEAAYHGAQVGVSTLVASVLWSRVRQLLVSGRVRLRFPDEGEMEERVRDAFAALDPSGAMAEECWRLYVKKLRRWAGHRANLERMDWKAVDEAVAGLVGLPADLTASLGAAGGPTRFSALVPAVPADLARWSLASCHLMRDRFTVADLAFFMGAWDADGVDSVLDEAATMGAGL